MESLEHAKSLRSQEKYEEALHIFYSLSKSSPDDPEISYQIGWTFDASDRCDQAIPFYEKALRQGLSSDRDGCMLALGSSLRAIGRNNDAKKVLEQGVKEFPDNGAFPTFLSITLYNLGKMQTAIRLLMDTLLRYSTDGGLQRYKRALQYYSSNLDEVLKPTVR